MFIIAIHKDSTKYITTELQEKDVQEYANSALQAFQRDLSDPEIHESRIAIIKCQSNPNIIASTTLDFINNPPENKPIVITSHGK